MSTHSEGSGGGLLRTLFGGARRREQIADLHAGDLHLDQPLHVVGGAAVAGDLAAPEVVVSGLVYGSILARELIVRAGGEVWGDVCTLSLSVEPGGCVHGWVHTVDEDLYMALWAMEDPVRARPRPELTAAPDAQEILPPELAQAVNGVPAPDGGINGMTWTVLQRLIQQETGAALMARTEIEGTFEQRLQEATAAAVQREAQMLTIALENARAEASALRDQHRETEELLAEREERVRTQAAELKRLDEELTRQREQTLEVEETLGGNLQSLQEAERRIEELEEQRLAAAREGAEATEEVARLRPRLVQADARLAELEEALSSVQQHKQGLEEQVAWYRNSVKAASASVRGAQEREEKGRRQIEALRQVVAAQKDALTRWKENMAEVVLLLRESKQREGELRQAVERLEAKAAQFDHQREEVEARWQQEVRDREGRIDALEGEIAQMYDNLETQGERLAEARAALAEQQLVLFRERATAREEAEEAASALASAAERVSQLEEQLDETQRKLKDVMTWVERRRRSPERRS